MVVRRMKTYSSEKGFVYQYYFVGKRQALASAGETAATEYVFDVTHDRSRSVYAISVFVRHEALDTWASAHGRRLTDTEQYAAAKLRLLRGFDEIEDISKDERRLAVSAEEIEPLLEPLALE